MPNNQGIARFHDGITLSQGGKNIWGKLKVFRIVEAQFVREVSQTSREFRTDLPETRIIFLDRALPAILKIGG